MKQWVTKRYQADLNKIAQRYQISEILAELLVKRGLFDWDSMSTYLFPEKNAMHDALQMKGLEEAARIIEQKIQQRNKIKIIGDYDVDGVMSTYILYRGIQLLGGIAGYRIPHRVHDGYGMRDYMAQEAYDEGYDTILTCDNGISAVSAVKRAKELGLTVVITDHHEVPKNDGVEELPPADVIVNPKQADCSYPFSELCGAGIAYKLMSYLFEKNGRTDCEEELLPFAAIATVCDVVPLLDENRIIVKNGLEYLNNCQNTGMHFLIEALQFGREINSGDLGFRIGPCINAAGRLGDAVRGLELLLETDKEKAKGKAQELVALNEERKDYTAAATKCAIELIEKQGLIKKPVFVLLVEGCHESVAGIVAGRIREKYYRPTLIITRSSNGLKGSARSIPGYHMQGELSKCRELLTEYGGHAMAAGFSLPEENLDVLEKALQENCMLTDAEMTEKVFFDREVPLAEMTETIVRQLEYMEPFGEGNERPVFAKRGVSVTTLALCGKENQIARLQLRDGLRLYRAVDFQCELHLGEGIRDRYGEAVWEQMKAGQASGYEIDILYQPEINKMFGNVEFRLVDCR